MRYECWAQQTFTSASAAASASASAKGVSRHLRTSSVYVKRVFRHAASEAS